MPPSALIIVHGRMYAGRRFIYDTLLKEHQAKGIVVGRQPRHEHELSFSHMKEAIDFGKQHEVKWQLSSPDSYEVD